MRGFSLIEILIYITIFAVVSVIIVDQFSIIYLAYNQSIIQKTVSQNIRHPLKRMTLAIREANDVVSASPSYLELSFSDPNQNPTIFRLNNGVVEIKEGIGDYRALTSANVLVENLDFEEITNPPDYKSVKIYLKISFNNQGNQQWQEIQEINTTVALR